MRRIAKLLSVAPIALAIAMAGCDSAQNLTAPSQTAQFAVKGANAKRAVSFVSPGNNSATVDASGGLINVLDAHNNLIAALYVPAGTVKKNTTFRIDIASDFTASLSATSQNSGTDNDVGHAGFKKGVQLFLNTNFMHTDSNQFGIGELKPGGQILPVDSYVSGNWVVGTLKHFSDYVPIDIANVPITD